jgi:putative ABC transport system ATP-binding protein
MSAAPDLSRWVPAILAAAEDNGVVVEPTVLRDALHDVRRHAAQRPFEGLREAGERLGLRVTPLVTSVDELVRVARSAPLLLWSKSETWIAVRRIEGSCAVVRDDRDVDVRLSREEVVAAVGVEGPGRPVVVAVVDSAMPLAQIAEPGRHGAHGGGHEEPRAARRVARLLAMERSDVVTCAVFAVFIGLATLMVPVAVQSLVNTVVFTTLTQPLLVLTLAVLATLALSSLLRGLQEWVVERLQQRLFVRTALDFVARLVSARADAFDETSATTRALRFFDVVTAQKTIAQLLTEGLALALQGIAGLLLLAFYHPFLLAFDVVLIVALLVVLFGFGRRAITTSIDESTAKYDAAGWILEVARNLDTFRASSTAGIERTEDLARSYLVARRANFRIVFRQFVAALVVQTLASAALLAVGGWLVLIGQLTVGQLVAAEIVVASVVVGFTKLAKHLVAYYDLATSLEKLAYVTDLPLERRDAIEHLGSEGPARLEVRGVHYDHPGGGAVFDGLDLTVEPGRRIGVLAPHGAGKSSLADLVGSLREPSVGSLRIDGVDLREIQPGELRRHVAIVRSTAIFEGTVFDNVTLSRPNIASRDVRRVLEAVGLADTIDRLPKGTATRITSGGHPLSRGEAQRLVLARALVGAPRLLVIDGLLDAIDPVTLLALEQCLTSLEATTTVLLLTSDPGVARFCHDVVEIGSRTAWSPALQSEGAAPRVEASMGLTDRSVS